MADGYLSRDREHLARMQRERRRLYPRIDYMPSREAAAVFAARKAQESPGSAAGTNGAVLDAILLEWAEMTGISYGEIEPPMTLAPAQSGPSPTPEYMTLARQMVRVRCGARRHRDGEPCQAWSEPGRRRCRFHGGRSTGPRTPEGKARVAKNLLKARELAATGVGSETG